MRREWTFYEERILIENYEKSTIKELEEMFPNRSRESINNKIKRLKKENKLTGGKEQSAIDRSYKQR